MAYLVSLARPSGEYEVPDIVIEVSSDTLALEAAYVRDLENGQVVIEVYRPNFRRRFKEETSYQFKIADDAVESGWIRGRYTPNMPHPQRGKVLHCAHAEKLGRFQEKIQVAVLINDKWEVYTIKSNKNPELAKRQEAKVEKKEKNERRRHDRRPSLLERVLSGFLPDD